MGNRVVHVEIPIDDPVRAGEFLRVIGLFQPEPSVPVPTRGKVASGV
jgi:hypothetical protein